ncbi:MAG TPA: pseudouridine-5'-phosphate glycosidase [Blastocatellia bacterium]|nr:pseudouridine-5'-phosphate glycosidase [Blastocatellia bacterium]
MKQTEIRIAEQVSRALKERKPVVALESTVIAHGLPHPVNLETALACEDAIRQCGIVPATIGIVEGVPTVGLSADEIAVFASDHAPDRRRIEKVGLNNLAAVITKYAWGATTVASSLRLAHVAGIRVFSTGGVGGVHREAIETFDISADLTALGGTPMICVCAGAKAILDLQKTVERLETLGVPIVGYGTNELPAFYSRRSGLGVDISVETPDEAAEVAVNHWRAAGHTAVLVCVPVPEEFEIPLEQVDRAATEALQAAKRHGIRGKALTPFLLAEMEKLTDANTVRSNRALLANNARIAAKIAASLTEWLADSEQQA